MKIVFSVILIIIMNFAAFSDSLYCIKYGESTYGTNYIFFGDKENKQVKFDWLFYLIKTKDKNILVDCGFYSPKLIKLYDVKYKNPIDILEENNINPDVITDIILTHSHFDHIENIIFFPNANIIIQKDELSQYIKDSYSNTKVKEFIKNHKKIITFEDSYNLLSNIKIKKIGGHTIGSSVVEIGINNKKYIIASDEIYLMDNFYKKIGVATYYNHKKNIDFINKLDSKEFEILTFHNPTNSILGSFLITE